MTSFSQYLPKSKYIFYIVCTFWLFPIQIEDLRVELQRKEQEMMQMQAKMKTVEEQHADYQKHIAVLKESLIAKEEHYNMLQLDVSRSICYKTSQLIL